MRNVSIAAVALLGLFPGSAAGDRSIPDDETARQRREPPEVVAAEEPPRILFLNRCDAGCTIEPGDDDSRSNRSSLVKQTSTVSGWAHGDENWDAMVRCVQETYAPYDIEVTDVDPGPDTHHLEAIVAGTWQEVGRSEPACGVAPWKCSPTDDAISFSFANSCYGGPESVCATVSQESGHAFGLQHALDCSDPMTYLPPCGRQFFRDKVAQCGLYEPTACSCGVFAQSSHGRLMAVLGPNPNPLPGPDIEILAPLDGDAVPESGPFSIVANATDMRGIDHVRFYLNGDFYGAVDGHPYNQVLPYDMWTPADLPPSIIDIEVRAYDDLGTESSSTVTITRGEPCTEAADCVPGQACDDGRCYFPGSRGELGDPCSAGLQCLSLLCPLDSRGGRCSELCAPEAESPCPDGFECVPVRDSTESVCWPTDFTDDGGCGCVVGRRSSPVPWALLTILAIAITRIVLVQRQRDRVDGPLTQTGHAARRDSSRAA